MKPIVLLSLLLISFGTIAQKQKKPKVSQIEKLANEGNYTEAIAIADAAIEYEKTKNVGKTWFSRALAYMKADTAGFESDKDLLAEAIAAFDKAQELGDIKKFFVTTAQSPLPIPFEDVRRQYWAFYFSKGAGLFNDKDFKNAVDQFELALKIDEKDTNSYINAALAAHNGKDYETAKRNYKGAIDNGAKAPVLYNYWASILSANDKDNDKAMEVLRMGREVNPSDPDLARTEINILASQGKAEQAITNVNAALENDPNNVELIWIKAIMFEELKQPEKAVEVYQKAIETDPKHFNSRFNYAALIYNQLINLVNEQNKLDYGDPKIDELEPKIQEKLGQVEEPWTSVLELDDKNRTALEALRYIYNLQKRGEEALKIQDRIDALPAEGEEDGD